MISQTKLKERIKRKTSPEIIEILRVGRKSNAWHKVTQIISAANREYSSVNLEKIDKETKAGDIVVIIGKVLSAGHITKKVRIAALGISEVAKEKLKESKSEYVPLLEEIKVNPKALGVKLIR